MFTIRPDGTRDVFGVLHSISFCVNPDWVGSCVKWATTFTDANWNFIQSNAIDNSHGAQWYRRHHVTQGDYWWGEVGYVGDCIKDLDFDCDHWIDDEDNCPWRSNSDQADEDDDGVGDACKCECDPFENDANVIARPWSNPKAWRDDIGTPLPPAGDQDLDGVCVFCKAGDPGCPARCVSKDRSLIVSDNCPVVANGSVQPPPPACSTRRKRTATRCQRRHSARALSATHAIRSLVGSRARGAWTRAPSHGSLRAEAASATRSRASTARGGAFAMESQPTPRPSAGWMQRHVRSVPADARHTASFELPGGARVRRAWHRYDDEVLSERRNDEE